MFERTKTKTFIIAEVGSNHGGNLSYAKKLAKLAKDAGASAVKFQTFQPDNLVNVSLNPTRHAHFAKLSLSHASFINLAEYCAQIGIEFMSSVWDEQSHAAMAPHISVNKLGSGDITNYKLIKTVVETDKPLILSTAMTTIEEVQEVVRFIKGLSPNFIEDGKLCIMHCVAMYGNPLPRFANFNMMKRLEEKFPNIEIGYSDHVAGPSAVLHALSTGTRVIEVHFTDNKEQEFRDHHLSVTPDEMALIVNHASEINDYYSIHDQDIVHEIETKERIDEFRRAIYFRRKMKVGEIISSDDLICLRPAVGIPANKYFELIGKKLNSNVEELEPLSFSILSDVQ